MLPSLDRTPPRIFVGRDAELDALSDRSRAPGLTVVRGPGQIGKTAVLNALVESLRDTAFVGYAASSGADKDLLLFAVAAAYDRWLTTSSYRDQLRVLTSRNSSHARSAALAFLVELASSTPVVGKTFGVFLKALQRLAHDERNANLPLAPVQYKQILDLVAALSDVSNTRVVLVLDQFERSSELPAQLHTIERLLNDISESRLSCHIFIGWQTIGVRANDAMLERLFRLYGERLVFSYELQPLRLSSDSTAGQSVTAALRAWIPAATKTLTDDAILEILDGFPGTLKRWLDERPGTEPELRRVAEASRSATYLALEQALEQLMGSPSLANVAARIALLPPLQSETAWSAVRDAVVNPEDETIQQLLALQILDASTSSLTGTYPSFGHITRHEAARSWFYRNEVGRVVIRLQGEHVIRQLIRAFGNDEAGRFSVSSLAALEQHTRPLDLPEKVAFLLHTTLAFTTGQLPSVDDLAKLRTMADVDTEGAHLYASIVSYCLVIKWLHIDAQLQQRRLDDLRRLARKYDHYPRIAVCLANALSGLLIVRTVGPLASSLDVAATWGELNALLTTSAAVPEIAEAVARPHLLAMMADLDKQLLNAAEQHLTAIRLAAREHVSVETTLATALKTFYRSGIGDADTRESLLRELAALADSSSCVAISEAYAAALNYSLLR